MSTTTIVAGQGINVSLDDHIFTISTIGNNASNFSVVCGGVTSTSPLQGVTGQGSIGQVLTSNGSGTMPTWQSIPPIINPLPVNQGGTGLTTAISYAIACGGTSSTSPLQYMPSVGTNGQVLTSSGSNQLPSWQTPATITNPLPVNQGGSGKQSLTAYSIVCGGITTTGALQSVSGQGSLGQVLTSNGSSTLPTWQSLPAGPTITPMTSWIPTVRGGTTVGVGTYTTQSGYWYQIGNLVHVQFYVVWTAHTGTGPLTIGILPMPCSSNTNYRPVCAITYGNIVLLTGLLTGLINPAISTTAIQLQVSLTGAIISALNITGAGILTGSIQYITP